MDISNFMRTPERHSQIEDGVWIKDIPGADDLELLVRGSKSSAIRAAYANKALQERVKRGVKKVNPEEARKVHLSVMAEHVLLGWRNVKDGKKDVPYTVELARDWMTNPLSEFVEFVDYAVSQVDAGIEEAVEELAGN